MKDELEKQIIETFPLLYKDMRGGGICVGGGWYNIIYDLSEELEKMCIEHIIQNPDMPKPTVSQIKEKFGGLRFYMHNATQEMCQAINRAEDRSHKTCEECGDSGEARDGGWILTLCDKCHEKQKG